jgi:hypothetical protein
MLNTPPISLFFDLNTWIIFGEEYRSWSSSLCSFLYSLVTLSLLGPNIFLNTSKTQHHILHQVYFRLHDCHAEHYYNRHGCWASNVVTFCINGCTTFFSLQIHKTDLWRKLTNFGHCDTQASLVTVTLQAYFLRLQYVARKCAEHKSN